MAKLIAFLIGVLVLTAAGCGGQAAPSAALVISDNVGAANLIEPGMTSEEVNDLLAKPRPPLLVLNLREADPEDVTMLLDPEDFDSLKLTMEDVDAGKSPYYAWVFFPTVTSSSQPTVVMFWASRNTVLNTRRLQCEVVLSVIALAGQHTGIPASSACQP